MNEKRSCELCGAEYLKESQDKTCSAKYPDLFHPEVETNCGGIILPAPGEESKP